MNDAIPDKVTLQANRFLNTLPSSSQRRLAKNLRLLELEFGQPLVEADQPIRHVFFPLDCLVSQLVQVDGQKSVEVDTVGIEGFVGLALSLDSQQTLRSIVQIPGRALRLDADRFRAALEEDKALRRLTHRYTLVTIHQISQSVACNAFHEASQRMCRWLLMCHDGVRKDEFPITQEFLSQMLGVRRPTVSDVAGRLQDEGLINYKRGRLRITDRGGLERRACQCYEAVRRHYERLLE